MDHISMKSRHKFLGHALVLFCLLLAFDLLSGTLFAQTVLPDADLGLMKVGGAVFDLALQADGKFIIGGSFTRVNGVPRNYLARLNADGSLDTSWDPNPDDWVDTITISGNTIYVGGLFRNIAGQPRGAIAAIDATTGLATSWDPGTGGYVGAIAVSGSTVYVGGRFSLMGLKFRNNIAAVDASSGVASSWNPNANGTVYDLKVAGPTVYAGGAFTSIGGQTRNRIAALDASPGSLGAATTWDPNVSGTEVDVLALSGSVVYAAGAFDTIGTALTPRRNLVAIDTVTGLATAWDPSANGEVFGLAVSGSTVYAGGLFTTMGQASPVTRVGLAALDATTGLPTAWNPAPNDQINVVQIAGGTVYAGGAFSSIAGESVLEMARLDAGTGLHVSGTRSNAGGPGTANVLALQGDGKIIVGGSFALASKASAARNNILRLNADGTLDSWNPNANSDVESLAISGSIVYVGGAFTSIGGQTRKAIAAVEMTTGNATTWHPDADGDVLGIGVSGSKVYAAGFFGTIGGAFSDPVARLNNNTNFFDNTWRPDIQGFIPSAYAVVPTATTAYIAGSFSSAGGQARNNLVELDTVNTDQFNTHALATAWNPNADNIVQGIVVAGSTIYVFGNFTHMSGQQHFYAAALNAATGVATAWNGNAGNASEGVLALAPLGGVVYVGGFFTKMGGQARSSIAALDAVNGDAVAAWNPGADGTVRGLLATGGKVYVAGDFSTIGGQARAGLAALTALINQLTITKSGSGTGTVSSSPAGINCGATCVFDFGSPTPVTLTATPDAGSVFTGWLGACTGTGPCNLTVNGPLGVSATFAAGLTPPLKIDVDANTAYDALTDGLLIVRYLSGLTGPALSTGALGQGATRNDAQILSFLNDIKPMLDVDGNGQVDPLTDGILIMRYLFGLRGAGLIQGATGVGATRDSNAIETYLGGLQ